MSNIKMVEQHLNNEETEIVTIRSNVFNENKNKLKAFSENLPKESELPSVPYSGGLFGWFNYDVTGSDLNRLTESIQDKMIEQNKVLVRTIQEFNTIYDTFSALDKEYIQGILVSLKAAEEANAKALKGIEGVQVNQNEIKQIINQQKQVIQVLKKFKERIEKIEHLAEVDKIFDAVSTMQSNVKSIETNVKDLEPIVANLTNEMKALLSSQSVFQDNLRHLKEDQVKQFQTVKQLISNQNENISKIESISTENKTNIETLNKDIATYGEKLESTTNEVTKNKMNFENAIKELHIGMDQQAESISIYLKSELSSARNEVTELSLLTRNLSKALKITQVISFASIAITCVLVILIISGVL